MHNFVPTKITQIDKINKNFPVGLEGTTHLSKRNPKGTCWRIEEECLLVSCDGQVTGLTFCLNFAGKFSLLSTDGGGQCRHNQVSVFCGIQQQHAQRYECHKCTFLTLTWDCTWMRCFFFWSWEDERDKRKTNRKHCQGWIHQVWMIVFCCVYERNHVM